MTVDHRCSLLSCLQVILMSTRWQVGKSLQLPALLLMFMFVPMFIISIGIGELRCIFKAIVKSILKSGLVLACEDSHEESLNERSGRSLQFTSQAPPLSPSKPKTEAASCYRAEQL